MSFLGYPAAYCCMIVQMVEYNEKGERGSEQKKRAAGTLTRPTARINNTPHCVIRDTPHCAILHHPDNRLLI